MQKVHEASCLRTPDVLAFPQEVISTGYQPKSALNHQNKKKKKNSKNRKEMKARQDVDGKKEDEKAEERAEKDG